MSENDIWLLIFSQIVGIQHHPKNAEDERMTPEQCARSADAYTKAAMDHVR